MSTFSLDQQPWIPVMTADGIAMDVNLNNVFCDAARISGLAGLTAR